MSIYNNSYTQPFLKWAGGKRWFISNYSHFLPKSFNKYIEPFLGSGAVFFFLNPTKSILADTNQDLIDTYVAVRDEWEKVLNKLMSHSAQHSVYHYYKTRASIPRKHYTRAARLIYLNRTCFNGIYRVNRLGRFNVPKGTKNTVIFPYDDFSAISKNLYGVNIQCWDFEKTIKSSHKGDFIYVDPPYTVKHNSNNFIKYNENIFSWNDQIRLSEVLVKASNRGVKILISNADSKYIHELYADNTWNIVSVERSSVIASKSKYRRLTTEVLIMNYEPDIK